MIFDNHYDNMYMQSTAIFSAVKHDNFQLNFFSIFFLILLKTYIAGTY